MNFWGNQYPGSFFKKKLSIQIGALTLSHSGSDAWQPEWIRVFLNDSTYLSCYNEGNVVIDDSQSLQLDCGPYKAGDAGSNIVELNVSTSLLVCLVWFIRSRCQEITLHTQNAGCERLVQCSFSQSPAMQ